MVSTVAAERKHGYGLTPWDAFLPQDVGELMDQDHGGHQGVVAGLDVSQRLVHGELGEFIMIYCN